MKHKYLLKMVAVVVLGLTVTLFAVEKQPGTNTPRLIRLKSNGDTIAELRIPNGAGYEITGKASNYEVTTGRQTAKGEVTIRIRHAGGSPVVVMADEIEVVPDRE
jgi:hypothetical protein